MDVRSTSSTLGADLLVPKTAPPSTPLLLLLRTAPLLVAAAVAIGVRQLCALALAPELPLSTRWPAEIVAAGFEYRYPYREGESVPYFTGLVIPGVVLSVVWCAALEAASTGRLEVGKMGRNGGWRAHVAICGLWEAYCWTTAVTELGKVYIQEPRPDYAARCWGLAPGDPAPDPLTPCTEQRQAGVPVDGLKSFPSGHTSSALCIGGYLTFYALHCVYCRKHSPFRRLCATQLRHTSAADRLRFLGHQLLLLLYMLPLWTGLWMGYSRIYDWQHHAWDVNAGATIGLLAVALVLPRVACELQGLDEEV